MYKLIGSSLFNEGLQELLTFPYPSPSFSTNPGFSYKQVCLHLTFIVLAQPGSFNSPVYFQEQAKKRERKVCSVCVCVCLCLCVSSTSGIPRPGPLLQVWNEKSTLTLQKWIRKHGGHNYQAPSGWNWRRWSANRSVSNHPPPPPCCLPSVIQRVYSSLFGARNGPLPLLTDWQAGGLVMPAGWVFGGRRRSLPSGGQIGEEKGGVLCLCRMLMYVHSCMLLAVEVPQPEHVLARQGPPADYKPCFMRARLDAL